jgi:hypothetical protein
MNATDDEKITLELIGQVMAAMRALQENEPAVSESSIKTIITRPMWEAFLRATKTPEGSEPTEWNGMHTIRVFGSETHVVESDEWWSFSCPLVNPF